MGAQNNDRKIRVAIVGVGNCASSLVQGVEYYRDADPTQRVPGLMHVDFGGYHVGDVEFVAAFDVDAKKVGRDLSEAIVASENNTIKIAEVPPLGVTVQRGHTYDGLGRFYRENPNHLVTFRQQDVITGWYAFPGQNALRITDTVNDHLQSVVAKRAEPEAALSRMAADVQALLPRPRG